MNIRTVTDIDQAIAEACDLHDLRAGQTGTRRAPRTPNPDQPADRPVVEFEAQEDDRTISTRMTAFRALMEAEDFKAADEAGLAILARPRRHGGAGAVGNPAREARARRRAVAR